jgi:hypothetical protein
MDVTEQTQKDQKKWGQREGERERDRNTLIPFFFLVPTFFFFDAQIFLLMN